MFKQSNCWPNSRWQPVIYVILMFSFVTTVDIILSFMSFSCFLFPNSRWQPVGVIAVFDGWNVIVARIDGLSQWPRGDSSLHRTSSPFKVRVKCPRSSWETSKKGPIRELMQVFDDSDCPHLPNVMSHFPSDPWTLTRISCRWFLRN